MEKKKKCWINLGWMNPIRSPATEGGSTGLISAARNFSSSGLSQLARHNFWRIEAAELVDGHQVTSTFAHSHFTGPNRGHVPKEHLSSKLQKIKSGTVKSCKFDPQVQIESILLQLEPKFVS